MDLLKAVVFTVDTNELENVTTGVGHEISQRALSLELTKIIIASPPVADIKISRGYNASDTVFIVEEKQNDHKKH